MKFQKDYRGNQNEKNYDFNFNNFNNNLFI